MQNSIVHPPFCQRMVQCVLRWLQQVGSKGGCAGHGLLQAATMTTTLSNSIKRGEFVDVNALQTATCGIRIPQGARRGRLEALSAYAGVALPSLPDFEPGAFNGSKACREICDHIGGGSKNDL